MHEVCALSGWLFVVQVNEHWVCPWTCVTSFAASYVTSLTSNQLAFLDPFSLACNTVRIVSQVQKDNIILAEYSCWCSNREK